MSTSTTGFGVSQRIPPSAPPFPPFPAGAANNGLSVDPGTGLIVLGNDVGGATAGLLSTRQIPTNGFSLVFTDPLFNTTNEISEAIMRISDPISGVDSQVNNNEYFIVNNNTGDQIRVVLAGLQIQVGLNTLLIKENAAGECLMTGAGLRVINGGGFLSFLADNTGHLVTLGDVNGVVNGTKITVDDTTSQIVSNAASGFIMNGTLGMTVNGNGLTGGGAHIISAVANGFANLNLNNDIPDLGQLFLTGSAWAVPGLIGARTLGFYNNGPGGIVLHSDNVAGSMVFGVNGIAGITIRANRTVNLSNVQNFATNALALAGGLVIGDLYRTAGAVMIVI